MKPYIVVINRGAKTGTQIDSGSSPSTPIPCAVICRCHLFSRSRSSPDFCFEPRFFISTKDLSAVIASACDNKRPTDTHPFCPHPNTVTVFKPTPLPQSSCATGVGASYHHSFFFLLAKTSPFHCSVRNVYLKCRHAYNLVGHDVLLWRFISTLIF